VFGKILLEKKLQLQLVGAEFRYIIVTSEMYIHKHIYADLLLYIYYEFSLTERFKELTDLKLTNFSKIII